VNEAAEETAAVGEKLLDNFNEKLNTPELKEATKEAIENASEVAEVAVKAFDKPLNKALDELSEAGTKAASAVTSGTIKVGTDALSAIPGVGAIVELGKIANDASRAANNVMEATSDATATIKELVEETRENIDEGLEKLDQKKEEGLENSKSSLKNLNKVGGSITNRVNKSIHQFENTNNTTSKNNNYQTRRKFSKNKGKSKRVRFAI
jgi:ABC-type transporter Mla subunit MlaD